MVLKIVHFINVKEKRSVIVVVVVVYLHRNWDIKNKFIYRGWNRCNTSLRWSKNWSISRWYLTYPEAHPEALSRDNTLVISTVPSWRLHVIWSFVRRIFTIQTGVTLHSDSNFCITFSYWCTNILYRSVDQTSEPYYTLEFEHHISFLSVPSPVPFCDDCGTPVNKSYKSQIDFLEYSIQNTSDMSSWTKKHYGWTEIYRGFPHPT